MHLYITIVNDFQLNKYSFQIIIYYSQTFINSKIKYKEKNVFKEFNTMSI